MNKQEEEQEELSRIEAEKIAENFRNSGRKDPLRNVPPALLSSEDIKNYIIETGAISPFFVGGNPSRLKKASYEGRIGDKAYKFTENNCLVEVCTNPLVVCANSIVFVECDLDFRLPDFIALRFNLQIRHVHRGLLLGTGPLIDPGFWGKLCIPLHNLTNENYSIPRSEGLIWIEFTKTSGKTKYGRDPLVKEDSKGHWNIKKFIGKAASPINGLGRTVAIRSSIPLIAKEADKRAIEAKKRAVAAEESAKSAERWVERIGTYGAIATIIGIILIIIAMYANIQSANNATQSAYESLMPQIQALRDELSNLQKDQWLLSEELSRLKDENSDDLELAVE